MEPAEILLAYIVLPLWYLAGLADWASHRATHIAKTAGPRESLIHLLMFAEVGLPLALCLLFEINALVLAVVIAALLVHEVTAFWDVTFAHRRRYLSPFEQSVHSFLELLPFAAVLLLALLHWPQAMALFGFGGEPARFELAWKRPPLPLETLALAFGAALLLALLPYLEELWRGLRARRESVGVRREPGA